MKKYSAMNTMQCFSSSNSLSNSSKDSKQMFLTARREPLIPPSNNFIQNHLHQNHHLQNQSLLNPNTNQNYTCIHPHHTVLSSSCSPSISSNSINVWTTINPGLKQSHNNDKIPSGNYSALTTMGRLNTIHHTNLHNKDDHHKDTTDWRTNSEKKFCFLLLAIGCILTFILLIFSLIFYFIVFKQGVNLSNDLTFKNATTSFKNGTFNLPATSSNKNQLNNPFRSSTDHKYAASPHPHNIIDKQDDVRIKKRRRLVSAIDGEFRILNRQFKIHNYEEEVSLIRESLQNFVIKNMHLCLNNTEMLQYRRGDNLRLNGVIVNFVFKFNCALPNLAKRIAFSLRDLYRSDYSIDFRTLRLTPIFDPQARIEFVDVDESAHDLWIDWAKDSEWTKWSDWSNCDCRNDLLVRSRQRSCFNKLTNRSAFSFACGSGYEDKDEHEPSMEIRNCDCEEEKYANIDLANVNRKNPIANSNKISSVSHSPNATEKHLHQEICMKCEKTNEICLSFNSQMPNCLKILNYNEKCGGHCTAKGTECRYNQEKNLHQCLHSNETGDINLCLEDEFRCADGLCIPNIKYCDGFSNCFDGSDEVNCPCDIESGEYIYCGNSTVCIHISKRCDANEDCMHGEDEAGCFKNCPEDDSSNDIFRCPTGNKECIPITRHCNNVRDCTFGEDEINCK